MACAVRFILMEHVWTLMNMKHCKYVQLRMALDMPHLQNQNKLKSKSLFQPEDNFMTTVQSLYTKN
jgi:hypothetical protein